MVVLSLLAALKKKTKPMASNTVNKSVEEKKDGIEFWIADFKKVCGYKKDFNLDKLFG